jgi:hypothetical protein
MGERSRADGHAIIHREQTGPQAEQGVCACGALIEAFWLIPGQTLASQFAAHVRRANEDRPRAPRIRTAPLYGRLPRWLRWLP